MQAENVDRDLFCWYGSSICLSEILKMVNYGLCDSCLVVTTLRWGIPDRDNRTAGAAYGAARGRAQLIFVGLAQCNIRGSQTPPHLAG